MTNKSSAARSDPCFCGNPVGYPACCGRFHSGAAVAPDAQSLMRSRYSAYVLGLRDYLLKTWAAEFRPAYVEVDQPGTRWLGLEVKRVENSGPSRAIVEFVARYKIAGKAHRLHEVSRFELRQGEWLYLTGQPRAVS